MEYITDIFQTFGKCDPTKCFNQITHDLLNTNYYLIETDRYDNVKIIDTSIIKERLEAKAKEYNDKSVSNRHHMQFYYEVKTLEKGFYDKETTDNSRSQN